LVGHSYAGMVIAGTADRAPERIRRLVYLDAVVPRDGESFYGARSIEPPAGDDWQQPVPFAQEETREYLPDLAEEDVPWFYGRMTPQLVKTLAQPVRLGTPAARYRTGADRARLGLPGAGDRPLADVRPPPGAGRPPAVPRLEPVMHLVRLRDGNETAPQTLPV
jgi:pimeloyl-ACP methyl ester carboxylesterase